MVNAADVGLRGAAEWINRRARGGGRMDGEEERRNGEGSDMQLRRAVIGSGGNDGACR
jgi:hypothetical protein